MKALSLSFLLASLLVLSSFTQKDIDLTGAWVVEVETDMGSGSPSFVLKQTGENITGTYNGSLGESQVKGTLKGDVLHLEFEIQGNKITYDGKATQDEISGTVDLAGMAKGTFKGKRK
ncbi:hypothetical protein DFQ04_0076 [Algoriphagus boseongensis]|uniref:Lipocalin-like protein n=1 Tax=Algoriphagus boseongensis TaxID=1442587 RepID=A0A4R6T5D0_9BACT|nr:hypothetical protein [Algoriphagus boseongensis]TDQ18278.1 hypothetical protein DFQ04_0076 [Algoriphagus boseongensis]